MKVGTRVKHGQDSGEVVGVGDLIAVLLYTRKAVISVAANELEVTYSPEEAAVMERRYSGRSHGHSGWGLGVPQCDGCRQILKGYNLACPNCGGYARPRDGARGG